MAACFWETLAKESATYLITKDILKLSYPALNPVCSHTRLATVRLLGTLRAHSPVEQPILSVIGALSLSIVPPRLSVSHLELGVVLKVKEALSYKSHRIASHIRVFAHGYPFSLALPLSRVTMQHSLTLERQRSLIRV